MARLLVILAALLLSLPALGQDAQSSGLQADVYPGHTNVDVASQPGAMWGVIGFEKDLFIPADIMLQGTAGYRRLDFSIPRHWKVLPGSKLELMLSHSPTLIADLSMFTVVINGVSLHTVRLNEVNVNNTLYVVDIPEGVLREFNYMELIAHQHYMVECEDPFDPSLLTRIHRESQVLVHYQIANPEPDLAAFPFPIFEERGYSESKLLYVVAPGIDELTLSQQARFQVGFGRWLRWRKTDFLVTSSIPDESARKGRHLIYIGDPQRNRALREFADLPPEKALPLPLTGASGWTTPNGARVPDDQGVVIFTRHPDDPALAMLILSGNSPEGVKKAVDAIAQLPYEKTIAGQGLVVRVVDPRPNTGERTQTGNIPNATTFTLEDIKFDDVTVRGFYSSPVVMRLNYEPDVHPVEAQQKMKLVYSYGAQLQKSLSSLEVILNGVSIDSKDLNVPEGEDRATLLVDLPVDLMRPRNEVVIRFHLYPDNYFHCGRVSDRHLWATVHKETEFAMPRDTYTYLPDLSFLRYDWYPYTLSQDLDGTSIVVPDKPSDSDLQALLTIATQLGRRTDSEGVWLKVYPISALPEDVKRSNHLIVLDSSPNAAMSQKLVGNSRLFYDGDTRVLKTIEDRDLKTLEFKGSGVVEQVNSPFNPDKTLLLVRGEKPEEMNLALNALSDETKLGKLSHNLAFSFDTGDVKSVLSSKPKLIGTIPVREEARTWIYLNFWQTALLVIGAFLAIYVLIFLARSISRRRAEAKKHIRASDLQ
jgi:hypothetical protein